MDVFKLQIWLEGSEDEGEKAQFRDFYFDASKITGFYIPNDDPEMDGVSAINVFFEGDFITIKQEPHILEYLYERFGKKAKKT